MTAEEMVREHVLCNLTGIVCAMEDRFELDSETMTLQESFERAVKLENNRQVVVQAVENGDIGRHTLAEVNLAEICAVLEICEDEFEEEFDDLLEDASEYLCRMEDEEDLIKMVQLLGLDPDESPACIYEYWAVSDWFGEALRNQGEIVIEAYQLNIWGRQATGQSVRMDGAVKGIYQAIEVPQKHSCASEPNTGKEFEMCKYMFFSGSDAVVHPQDEFWSPLSRSWTEVARYVGSLNGYVYRRVCGDGAAVLEGDFAYVSCTRELAPLVRRDDVFVIDWDGRKWLPGQDANATALSKDPIGSVLAVPMSVWEKTCKGEPAEDLKHTADLVQQARIVVRLEEGLVSEVWSDSFKGDFAVIDMDVEGIEDHMLSETPDGNVCFFHCDEVQFDPKYVEEVFNLGLDEGDGISLQQKKEWGHLVQRCIEGSIDVNDKDTVARLVHMVATTVTLAQLEELEEEKAQKGKADV